MARPGTALVVAHTGLALRQTTIIIRIVSFAIAVIIQAVRAVGLVRWRRTTVDFTVALVLARITLAITAVVRFQTVNPAVDIVFRAFTLSISTAIRL